MKIRKAPLAPCKGPQEGLQPTCLGARQPRAEAEQAHESMASSISSTVAWHGTGASTGLGPALCQARGCGGVTWREAVWDLGDGMGTSRPLGQGGVSFQHSWHGLLQGQQVGDLDVAPSSGPCCPGDWFGNRGNVSGCGSSEMREHQGNGLGAGSFGSESHAGLEREWSRLLGQSGDDGDSLTMGVDVLPVTPAVARASP